jgi:hypothetical protein
MSNNFRIVSLPILFLSAWSACSAFAQPQQQATASFKAVHVIGMQGVKHNTKGKVILSKDALEFATGGTNNELSITSIQAAFTGADSQRLIAAEH